MVYQPLEFDEDDQADSDDALVVSDEDCSEGEQRSRPRSKKGSFGTPWQQSFSCMSKHDGKGLADNPNARTIEVLQQMADHYERHHDHWRLTAYRRVISAPRKQTTKISTAKEASTIPFVGGRLADKIEEIVWTDSK